MRLVSWNVNGLRAVLRKGLFYPAFDAFAADVFALQETKMQEGQVELELPEGYHQVWSSAERKGYSGTAVFCREAPLRVLHRLGLGEGGELELGPGAGGPPVPEPDADGAPGSISSGDCADSPPGSTPGPGADSPPSPIPSPTRAARRPRPSHPDPSVLDSEGRLCACEFERFWLLNCYTPNAQDGLARLPLRLAWGEAFTRFAAELAAAKPVVICGDLNVAHNEIDLARPSANRGNAGFSDEERADFQALLDAGFIDSFRHLYPDAEQAYTWWSFRGNARANNTGWRIDYFLVSAGLKAAIAEASIWPEVEGSDHCPVSLELAL